MHSMLVGESRTFDDRGYEVVESDTEVKTGCDLCSHPEMRFFTRTCVLLIVYDGIFGSSVGARWGHGDLPVGPKRHERGRHAPPVDQPRAETRVL